MSEEEAEAKDLNEVGCTVADLTPMTPEAAEDLLSSERPGGFLDPAP